MDTATIDRNDIIAKAVKRSASEEAEDTAHEGISKRLKIMGVEEPSEEMTEKVAVVKDADVPKKVTEVAGGVAGAADGGDLEAATEPGDETGEKTAEKDQNDEAAGDVAEGVVGTAETAAIDVSNISSVKQYVDFPKIPNRNFFGRSKWLTVALSF